MDAFQEFKVFAENTILKSFITKPWHRKTLKAMNAFDSIICFLKRLEVDFISAGRSILCKACYIRFLILHRRYRYTIVRPSILDTNYVRIQIN